MDIEDLRNGIFGTALFDAIDSSSDFIVVLTPGSLDRCVNKDDWVRAEIAQAIKLKKNIIPVMAKGFSFAGIELPEDLASLPQYSGVGASHELFDASLDKIVSKLVAGRRALGIKMAATIGVAMLVAVLGLLAWQKNREEIVKRLPDGDSAGLAEALNEAGLDAGLLKGVEKKLVGLRKTSSNRSDLLVLESNFTAKTTECVSNELRNGRSLISPWAELSEYANWNQRLLLAESKDRASWYGAWSAGHQVIDAAQALLTDKVSEAQSSSEVKMTGRAAMDAANWVPELWRDAIESFSKGVRAQKAGRWREAWTNFQAFEARADLAVAQAGQLCGQYNLAKANYQKMTLCLGDKDIQAILAEQAGEDLLNVQNFGVQAAQQANPEGLGNYSNAAVLWPKVVGKTVTNLLQAAALALTGKQWDSGLQATTNAIILAERTKLSGQSGWYQEAVNLKNRILAAKADAQAKILKVTPANPPAGLAASATPSRFELVGNNIIIDRKLNRTWIVSDIQQPMSLSEFQDREAILREKTKYNADLPNLEQLQGLATAEKQHWPNGDEVYLDAAFATKLRGGGPWQLSKKCCTTERGIFYDFDKNRSYNTAQSEKGIVLLQKSGITFGE